jgi:F420-non-reducing hydrogenase iron-sulfur subunit
MSCRTMPNVEQPSTDHMGAVATGQVRIVAFLCNWCSYAGADKTGMNQLHVPPELSVVRVMCSGRVEPTLVLEAFQKGADGVMVLACHPGDCHYKEGNLRAFCRAELLERMMPQLGVDPTRFCFDYVSAAEAEKFAQVTSDFVAAIRALTASHADQHSRR